MRIVYRISKIFLFFLFYKKYIIVKCIENHENGVENGAFKFFKKFLNTFFPRWNNLLNIFLNRAIFFFFFLIEKKISNIFYKTRNKVAGILNI